MSHFSLMIVCKVHHDVAFETDDDRVIFCPACGHGDNLADKLGVFAHDGARYETIGYEELQQQDWGANDHLRQRLLEIAEERS